MTYAAIYGGGRALWNFQGFSPKVTYIFKLSQYVFPAKATLRVVLLESTP